MSRALILALALASATAWAEPAPPLSQAQAMARVHYECGRHRYALRDYKQALEEFERAYELSPVPALLVNIGQAARKAGFPREAVRAYQRFLDSRAGSPRVRAEVWEALDELLPAPPAAAAGSPTRLDSNAAAHFAFAKRRFAAGQYHEALLDFEAAYEAFPAPELLVNIGQCLRKLDRLEDAAIAFKTFLELRGGTRAVRLEVWEALDQILVELDARLYRLAESVAQFRQFLDSGQGDAGLRAAIEQTIKAILDELSRIDEAIALRQLDPHQVTARSHLAIRALLSKIDPEHYSALVKRRTTP